MININIDFEIEFNSPVFTDFSGEIQKRLGESQDDRDFSPKELADKIPNKAWKQLIKELTFADPVLKIYPRGSPIFLSITEEELMCDHLR